MIEALSVLGSLASLASLLIQVGVRQRSDGTADIEASIEAVGGQVTPEQRKALGAEGASEVLAHYLTIEPEILDTISQQLKQCTKEYNESLIKGRHDRRQLDMADRRAEQCICNWLNRLRIKNDGKLPAGPYFKNLWKSYRCLEERPY